MHLNPRMEPQSLLLALHSEEIKSARLKGEEMQMAPFIIWWNQPSEVRKLELKQGTKLQLASFGSTRPNN